MLEVGVNSYISVDDADTYFEDRHNSTRWNSKDATEKARALISATQRIDNQHLRGKKASSDQDLEFPRNYLNRYGVWIEETEVSDVVRHACCEEALALLSSDSESQLEKLTTAGVVSIKLGDESYTFSEEILKAKARCELSPMAQQLLKYMISFSPTVI